jgi:hypothetical protein
LALTPWMLTTMLWPTMLRAILPLSLRELIRELPDIARRLIRMTRNGDGQLDEYRERYRVPSLALQPSC